MCIPSRLGVINELQIQWINIADIFCLTVSLRQVSMLDLTNCPLMQIFVVLISHDLLGLRSRMKAPPDLRVTHAASKLTYVAIGGCSLALCRAAAL